MSFNSDPALQSNQLPISIDFPQTDKKEFLDTLTLIYKRIANSVNTKEGAFYLLDELATFKQYFTLNNPQVNRNVYRKTFDLVSLNGGLPIAPAAVVSQPHNIVGLSSAALVYAGCTSNDPFYFTVVYPDIYLDATDIVFTNNSGNTITACYGVAEYLKN